jgi:hypothetical protein
MGTTRRYRATDKTKTEKPKKKISKRAALIKKVEKEGKVELRTDWSALHRKKKPIRARPGNVHDKAYPPKIKKSDKATKRVRFTAQEKKLIERIGSLNKELKAKKRKG